MERYRRQSHGQNIVVNATASQGSWVAVKAKHQYSATKTIGNTIQAGYHNGNG